MSVVPTLAATRTRLRGAAASACLLLVPFATTFDRRAEPSSSPVSFHSLAAAQSQRLSIRQVRRAVDNAATGSWLAIHERLEIGADRADGRPRFALEFDAAASEHLPVDVALRVAESYRRHSSYLYLHTGFRVTDAAAAERSYVVQYLDSVARLGRPAHRVAILPRTWGRNAWLLDVDIATGYPLHQAEYNSAGSLVAMIEVTRLDNAPVANPQWWVPRLPVSHHSTVAEAASLLVRVDSNRGFHFPATADLARGFALHDVRLIRDDLRPEATLAATYTDGVDTFTVMASSGHAPPSVPAPVPGSSEPVYAIYSFEDAHSAQHWFFVDSVRYAVIGRGGQPHLSRLAMTLLENSLR